MIWSIVFFIAAAVISAFYEEIKEEEGFLDMNYSGENTFEFCWIMIKMHLCEVWIGVANKTKKMMELD